MLSSSASRAGICSISLSRSAAASQIRTFIVTAFLKYMDHEGHKITRAQFEKNLALKLQDPAFLADIGPLLAADYEWNPQAEAEVVSSGLIERLPGDPWKGKP